MGNEVTIGHVAILLFILALTIWCGVKTFKDDKPKRTLNR